jgi:hypothetical protein
MLLELVESGFEYFIERSVEEEIVLLRYFLERLAVKKESVIIEYLC